MSFLYSHLHPVREESFQPSSFCSESRLIFLDEQLHSPDSFKQPEKKTIGQEAVETHERAEHKKNNIEKSPLTKFIEKNPDSAIAAATESRTESLSDAVQDSPHAAVLNLMSNIPQNVGESIAGSLMNDYI